MKTWQKLLLAAIGIALVASAVFALATRKVGATSKHTEWQHGRWSEWGECRTKEELSCGQTGHGWKSRTRTNTCVWENGHGGNECSPVGKTEVENEEKKCEIKTDPCEPEGQCWTICGKEAMEVPDGRGGVKQCPATSSCEPRPDPNDCGSKPECAQPQGAPVCTDGTVLELPANFHVVRAGDSAQLKWIPTGGSGVNVFYKEVDQPGWTHALGDQLNDGDLTIGGLKVNLGYTFGLMQKNNCGDGKLVTAVVVDGPLSKIFTQSYWEWF